MAKKLWGGRFAKKTDPLVEEFTRSIQYDYKLAPYDIIGSRAHIRILRRAGILTPREMARMDRALRVLGTKLAGMMRAPRLAEEDIHTYIQNELEGMVGELGLKLHTARSRNDQVAFATKLYCKASLGSVRTLLADLAKSLDGLGRKNGSMIIPGFTHLQHAQPVMLKDYLGAYARMLERDAARLAVIGDGIVLTMGSGALAGTPIDARHYALDITSLVREGVGATGRFVIQPPVNTLDTVSDRDFVIEIAGAAALAGTHLSRLAEDLIIWATAEFGFVEIDDAYCTGSSLMPQKKNPDTLELIRGSAGRFIGNLVSVLTMMKGLPLSYNRDMQLDKEPLFASLELLATELSLLAGLVRTLSFNAEAITAHLADESLYATDLVYYLVSLGVPFKIAHARVGELVRYSTTAGVPIKGMPEGTLREKLDRRVVKKEILKRFDPVFSIKSKRSVRR